MKTPLGDSRPSRKILIYYYHYHYFKIIAAKDATFIC